MKAILNAAQMKLCDSYTSDHFGVEPVVLMERAALSVFISICNCGKMYEDTKTLIVCGTGNNGADGLALARIMFESGYFADYCIPFDEGRHSELFDRQRNTLEKYGLSPVKKETIGEDYDIIVDAMFGIGLTRDLSPDRASFIEKINGFDAFKVALDIPSGINADNGSVMGCAFKADITVTFGFAKKGIIVYPGKEYAGEVLVANIGITEKSLEGLKASLNEKESTKTSYLMEEEDLIRNLPKRPKGGNKGTFGKVLIYAGSENISGACILSALSALKSGAGMVKIITCKENAEVIKQTVPEAMLTVIDENSLHNIEKDLDWVDVLLAGPGIGMDAKSREMLEFLLKRVDKIPIVIDADGLNIIAEEGGGKLTGIIKNRQEYTLFTPHMGELSRLMNVSVPKLKEDCEDLAFKYAQELGICIAAKDAVTFVSDGEEKVYISSGNSGMATAGSGDVLAGICASFIGFVKAKKGSEEEYFEAVKNAVYIHGMAGCACLESMSEDSVTAGDIIVSLQRVLKIIRDKQGSKEKYESRG